MNFVQLGGIWKGTLTDSAGQFGELFATQWVLLLNSGVHQTWSFGCRVFLKKVLKENLCTGPLDQAQETGVCPKGGRSDQTGETPTSPLTTISLNGRMVTVEVAKLELAACP